MCPHWDGTTLEREITDHMRLNAANTYHTTAQNFTTLPNTSKKSCYQAAPKCTDCQEYYAPRMSQWCSVLHSSPFSFLAGVGERIGRKWMKMENHCVDPALRLYGREESTYEESTSYHLAIGHLQSIFLPGLWAQGFEKGFWGQSASGTLGASGQAVDRLKLLPCKTK